MDWPPYMKISNYELKVYPSLSTKLHPLCTHRKWIFELIEEVYTHRRIHLHTYLGTHVHIQIRTHTHVRTQFDTRKNIHLHTNSYTFTHTHTKLTWWPSPSRIHGACQDGGARTWCLPAAATTTCWLRVGPACERVGQSACTHSVCSHTAPGPHTLWYRSRSYPGQEQGHHNAASGQLYTDWSTTATCNSWMS